MATYELDAGCEPGLPRLEEVSDENTPWLVLFASVLYGSRDALEQRAWEWRELFGEGEPWHTTRG